MLGMAVATKFVVWTATVFYGEVNPKEHLDNKRAAYDKAKL